MPLGRADGEGRATEATLDAINGGEAGMSGGEGGSPDSGFANVSLVCKSWLSLSACASSSDAGFARVCVHWLLFASAAGAMSLEMSLASGGLGTIFATNLLQARSFARGMILIRARHDRSPS